MYKIIYVSRSFIAASLLLILISGCGTIQRHQIDGLYPATKGDVFLIYAGFSNFIHMEGKVPLSQQVILRPTLIIIGIVDLPISLTTDTLLMPYDIAAKNDENQNHEEEIEK